MSPCREAEEVEDGGEGEEEEIEEEEGEFGPLIYHGTCRERDVSFSFSRGFQGSWRGRNNGGPGGNSHQPPYQPPPNPAVSKPLRLLYTFLFHLYISVVCSHRWGEGEVTVHLPTSLVEPLRTEGQGLRPVSATPQCHRPRLPPPCLHPPPVRL